MAVNLRSSSHKFAAAAAFANRLVSPSSSALLPRSSSRRRSVHGSVYDKNVDDHVRPAVVPDDIIQPHSDNYWAPNPNTGVFGPASDQNPASGGDRTFHTSCGNSGSQSQSESVLEQKAFFRPLEDLDKPDQA